MASGAKTTGATRGDLMRARLAGLGRSLLALIPVILLVRGLLAFTEHGLWVPPEWRWAVETIGGGLGLGLFHLVRSHSRESAPATPAPIGEGTTEAYRKQLEREHEQARRRARVSSEVRGLACLVVTALLIAADWMLLSSCKQPWEPSDQLVRAMCQMDPDDRSVPVDPRALRAPFYLESSTEPWRGSVIFPIDFPRTAAAAEFLGDMEQDELFSPTDSPRTFAIHHHANEARSLLDGVERTGVALTLILLVALHVGTMISLSVGWAYTFSVAEELFRAF